MPTQIVYYTKIILPSFLDGFTKTAIIFNCMLSHPIFLGCPWIPAVAKDNSLFCHLILELVISNPDCHLQLDWRSIDLLYLTTSIVLIKH